MEICSWCQSRKATHWTFWTQELGGRGQRYAYCSCDTCWRETELGKYEVTRDEWLVAKTMTE